MRIQVSAKQVQKNREGIKARWKKIPAKWVELDTFIASTKLNPVTGMEYGRPTLVKICDGKTGPHNPCGAVGCFAGWNWMYHPYQAWCRRNSLTIPTTVNLSVYLGLQVAQHSYFAGRDRRDMTEKQEVNVRIKGMMKELIVDYPQEVVGSENKLESTTPVYG